MKALLKPLLLGSALTSLGLCCTISYASAILPLKSFDEQKFQSQKVISLSLSNKQTLITSIPGNKKVTSILNKPLLMLEVNESPLMKPVVPGKKNEFFEIASIFNDKLQQFISSFSSNENSNNFDTGKMAQPHVDSTKSCRKSKSS